MITFEQFKKALGKTGENMSDEEVEKLMTVFDYLSENWLDSVEIKIFGQTIKELTSNR